jgi:hypothetical protein
MTCSFRRYSIKVWRKCWVPLMTNVIAACERNNCKLVFFDNVYALGLVRGEMKEDTPMAPCSLKGQVRKEARLAPPLPRARAGRQSCAFVLARLTSCFCGTCVRAR